MSQFNKIVLNLFLLLSLTGMSVHGQAHKEARSEVRKGNKQYTKESYNKAEIAYLKALEADPKSSIANYNLGNALFKQKKVKEALEKYQIAQSQTTDKKQLAAISHNAGNCLMDANEYDKAVDMYKSSLRLNPSDDETRYNLAVAQAMLKKQQQQKKDNKDKDKKDQKKDDQKDKQQQQQQQKQDDQQKQQPQNKDQQPKDQKEQVTKEKAQQLLDALMQDEKDTQNKVKKLQMQQSQSKNPENDW
jgi:tetratricopeptide (TPR) repeat protein